MEQFTKPAYQLIFTREKLLVRLGDAAGLPAGDFSLSNWHVEDNPAPDSALELKTPSGSMSRAELYLEAPRPPEGFEFIHLRTYAHSASAEAFSLAGRAYQLLYWDATHRYCGRCGAKLPGVNPEHSKTCTVCGLQVFPQIAPAIIIAVIRDGKLLLGHNARFPEGLYSLIAGFMEPGETIEQCARREVFEETGIQVGRIGYYGSQPWPFPHSLMIGLTGDYEKGEIRPDGEEITDARWFSPDTLPNLPGPGSISRKIIDWYIEEYSDITTLGVKNEN